MDSAGYYFDETQQDWIAVPADEYQPEMHGDKDVCCSDPNCRERIIFRETKTSHGGSTPSRRIYVAKSRQAHEAKGCQALGPEVKIYSNGIDFVSALKDERLLDMYFNMDFSLGNPVFGKLGDVRIINRLATSYNRSRKGPYGRVAIHNLFEYESRLERIEEERPDVLNRVQIAHCQHVRPRHHFDIRGGQQDEKLSTVFAGARWRAYQKGASLTDIVYGFPHYFLCRPEFDHARETATSLISTTFQTETRAGAKLYVRNHIMFASEGLKEKAVSAGDQFLVAATPCLIPTRFKAEYRAAAMRASEGAHDAVLYLDWQVDDEQQLMPAPDAQLHLRPLPSPDAA